MADEPKPHRCPACDGLSLYPVLVGESGSAPVLYACNVCGTSFSPQAYADLLAAP